MLSIVTRRGMVEFWIGTAFQGKTEVPPPFYM
jgi:hypothetical protein